MAPTVRLLARPGIAAALGALSLAPSKVQGQSARSRSVIDGFVSDSNLVALGEATASLLGSPLRVTTGENGRFRVVVIPAGQYILMLHRVGYAPVSAGIQIGDADTLRLSFTMRRIVTALDTMVVSAKAMVARMTEFDERRKLGFGTFITAEQIEGRHAVALGDVLRTIPSVNVVDGGSNTQLAFSTRTSSCPMQIVIDGVQLPTPANLRALPPPSDIMGMEVYAGPATIPLRYKSSNSGCGVILIWTK